MTVQVFIRDGSGARPHRVVEADQLGERERVPSGDDHRRHHFDQLGQRRWRHRVDLLGRHLHASHRRRVALHMDLGPRRRRDRLSHARLDRRHEGVHRRRRRAQLQGQPDGDHDDRPSRKTVGTPTRPSGREGRAVVKANRAAAPLWVRMRPISCRCR
ncbi:hypothetical protein FRIGORI9N_470031 [Frigoribacterium sp. 9N]|nr:hypothetical protein FRIGORI9N_470031 [Frigoribacterium sp. 9N]